MHDVKTKITDKAYAKIQASGKSFYQFVQDSITDAINSEEKKRELLQLEEGVKIQIKLQIEKLEIQTKSAIKSIAELQQQHFQKLEIRVNETLNKHEGAQKEYNRILNGINQHLEEMLKTNLR